MYLYLAQQAVHSANSWQPLEAPWKYYSQLGHIKDDNRRKYAGKQFWVFVELNMRHASSIQGMLITHNYFIMGLLVETV